MSERDVALRLALRGAGIVALAVALLGSGLSSSAVGTLAGQVVMQGFILRTAEARDPAVLLRNAVRELLGLPSVAAAHGTPPKRPIWRFAAGPPEATLFQPLML